MPNASGDARDQPDGSALPWVTAAIGVGAVPLMLVSPMSFVVGLGLAALASVLVLVVLNDPAATPGDKGLAFVGAVGVVIAVLLFVLPYLLQD